MGRINRPTGVSRSIAIGDMFRQAGTNINLCASLTFTGGENAVKAYIPRRVERQFILNTDLPTHMERISPQMCRAGGYDKRVPLAA